MFNARLFFATLTAIGLTFSTLPSLATEEQLAPAFDEPQSVNLWRPGDPGQRLHIHGQVLSITGEPIVGAVINIWQADGNGNYHQDRYRASLTTGKEGRYSFGTVLPGQYYGIKHIHLTVTHHNHSSVTTEILFQGDPNLDESQQREQAIFLEEAEVKGETVLFGRFDIEMP